MDRLDKVTDMRIDKLKRKMEKEKQTKKKLSKERKNLLKKKKGSKPKDIILVKSIRDVPLTKSEVLAVQRVLMAYIKKNRFFKKEFNYDSKNPTDRYLMNEYKAVFKTYNKLSNNDENKPIYQIKLV